MKIYEIGLEMIQGFKHYLTYNFRVITIKMSSLNNFTHAEHKQHSHKQYSQVVENMTYNDSY